MEQIVYTCQCGKLDGDEKCSWTGPLAGLELVEYMPESVRSSHAAAGNSGRWPMNGAIRAAVEHTCADRLEDYEGDPNTWAPGCTWFERLATTQAELAQYAQPDEEE